jgi:hypothetical protein
MKNRVGTTAVKHLVLWLSLGFGPLSAWSQTAGAFMDPPPASDWKIIKHDKHLTVRVNPATNVFPAGGVEVGEVTYTGSTKKLNAKDAAKVVAILRACLEKDLAATEIPHAAAGNTLKVNAEIRSVRRSHPLINAVSIAAIFVPVDLGAAKVTARVVDAKTGQAVAEIDLAGSGRIYQVISSLQPLGQGKIVLKHESRSIAKVVARLRSDQQTPASTAVAVNGR